MPAGSPWAIFNEARKTGITRTTQALEYLFGLKPPALVAALGDPANIPFAGLPQPFRGELQKTPEHLGGPEIQHIQNWPDNQKEDVRAAVKNAIDNGKDVRFFWKLTDDDAESTSIQRAANGDFTITFFSPWRKVRPVGPNDVTVDV